MSLSKRYDAGLLSDYGGGDVAWWQDYLRAELGRADDFYATTIDTQAAEIERLNHLVRGYQHHLDACEQIAGKALGYPWFKDDPANFPDATEADGVCIGEHVSDTIVQELANKLAGSAAEIERLRASLDEALGVLRPFGECARYFDAATNPMPDSIALNHSVTLGDMRAARDFITKHGGKRE